jgi:cell division transport system permease protein
MKGNFRYFFREGSRNMFSHGFMSFAAIGITVACLLIMGTFSLVAYNADYNLKNLQKENAVLAFIDESLTEDQARALQGKVEAVPNVADATFVSREQARDSYVAQYDENDLYADLDPSIFRHRFVVHLQDETQLSQTVEALRGVEHVAKVRADEAVSAGFITARNVAGVISIALIAILLVVSVFIISNTIKLTTFDRRDEIAIMKMVGATDGFIRWPFVFEGLLLGLFGAVIAFFLQWLLYNAIASGIAGSDSLQILRVVSFQKIGWPVGGVFLLAGILVGVGGSLTAIRKFLRV